MFVTVILVTMYLIRHATAGVRNSLDPHDDQRPLDSFGVGQALSIADRLGGETIEAVLSSPAMRCIQTVEPLAGRVGLSVTVAPELSEGGSTSRSIEFLRSFTGRNVVLCSHGDVIPDLLRMLEVGGTHIHGLGCAKGSVWQLDNSTDQVASALYLGPVDQPAAS